MFYDVDFHIKFYNKHQIHFYHIFLDLKILQFLILIILILKHLKVYYLL